MSFNNFCIIFFTYIKIFKDSSNKYYQNKNKRVQKKLMKDIKVFLKKKRTKSKNNVNKRLRVVNNLKKIFDEE